jgi:hypothetical protein
MLLLIGGLGILKENTQIITMHASWQQSSESFVRLAGG